MHPETVKSIARMRAKCKDESDHRFVDYFESACRMFEAPREPIDPFKNLFLSEKSREVWNNAIRDLINKNDGK